MIETTYKRDTNTLNKLKNKEEIIVSTSEQTSQKIEEFYSDFYSSTTLENDKEQIDSNKIINVGSEDLSEITCEKIQYALKKMGNVRKKTILHQ